MILAKFCNTLPSRLKHIVQIRKHAESKNEQTIDLRGPDRVSTVEEAVGWRMFEQSRCCRSPPINRKPMIQAPRREKQQMRNASRENLRCYFACQCNGTPWQRENNQKRGTKNVFGDNVTCDVFSHLFGLFAPCASRAAAAPVGE
jgi:hypothetical protein